MALLGVPFDGTSGGRPRQAEAPALIRQALPAARGPEGPRIWDAGDVLTPPVDVDGMRTRVHRALVSIHDAAPDGLPVLIGGEHTVSLPAVEALKPASIVSLDAHPDLWDEQHGRKVAQGTWLRRAVEALDCELVLPMARAARGEELDAIDELGVQAELPDELPEPVYLTVDVDVFDPQDAPGVVWPEPGGPTVDEVLALVGQVAARFELAGVDVVEVNAGEVGPTVDLAARVLATALAAADRPS